MVLDVVAGEVKRLSRKAVASVNIHSEKRIHQFTNRVSSERS
jgi:hypothetical protein